MILNKPSSSDANAVLLCVHLLGLRFLALLVLRLRDSLTHRVTARNCKQSRRTCASSWLFPAASAQHAHHQHNRKEEEKLPHPEAAETHHRPESAASCDLVPALPVWAAMAGADRRGMTAFNMEEEKDEGHFDADGNFVWDDEAKKMQEEAWLDGVSEQQMEHHHGGGIDKTGTSIQPGKLFIGGVSWETSEDTLRHHFGKYGALTDAALMKDKYTGQPRGFGFVTFADASGATADTAVILASAIDRVLEETHMLDGRSVEVKRAIPREKTAPGGGGGSSDFRGGRGAYGGGGGGFTEQKKIFVGGLAPTVTEQDFRHYFEEFGKITDAVVMIDRDTQRSRGFGFITFEEESSVAEVISKSHEIHGKTVEIKRAESSGGPYGGNGNGEPEAANRRAVTIVWWTCAWPAKMRTALLETVGRDLTVPWTRGESAPSLACVVYCIHVGRHGWIRACAGALLGTASVARPVLEPARADLH
ncbi:hypothetical protein ON010_g4344 [Phytophthora cinnamomi]|nr:hypothetical protein ON010_g4344 [Phytophthora cinnamomi]